MKLLPTFYAKVENTKLKINDVPNYLKVLEEFEGKEVEVTIKRREDNSTETQRRLYWHYLRQIGSYTGNHPEELHEEFKKMFLKVGGDQPGYISTRNLTVQEFQEYIEKIRQKVAEIEIELKDPRLG